MTDDDDDEDIRNFLDAMDRALAVHEAGHAVVAMGSVQMSCSSRST